MDATELAFSGIARQAALIAAGEVSARELLELYLDRIARLDGRLNAFRVLFAQRARGEADRADKRRRESPGQLLLGVPIAVKDDIDVAGEVTAWGTNAHGGPARADAEVVRRLRAAGAVILGKTNVPEMTIWPFTESATFGVTRNPWELQRAPGGSSGGSAAAVAAGLVGAALGSDGAGSIRIPAAWCGLFGLKPQRDRVPLSPHDGAWHGLSVNGVLTRSVADTALFLDAIAQQAPRTGSAGAAPAGGGDTGSSFLDAVKGPPARLRIAYSKRMPPGVIARLDRCCARAVDDAVALLRSLGHEVHHRDPDYGTAAFGAVLPRYLRGIHDDAAAMASPQRLERRTRAMARMGALVPRALLQRSVAYEPALRARLNMLLGDHDVLLTPTTAAPPPRIGQFEGRGALYTLNTVAGMVPFNGVWNATGQPAASVPAALGADGLPRGVQLVVAPGKEALVLSLAAHMETARPWAQARPPLFA